MRRPWSSSSKRPDVPTRLEHFTALVERQPDNELFRFSLAQALVAENRLADAVPHYRYCVEKLADWMMPRILLGKLLLQLGRPEEAKACFTEALALAVAQHHEDPERELRELLRGL